MKLKKLLPITLAAAGLLVLAGCGGNNAVGADEVAPSEFVFAQSAAPVGLSPTLTNDSASSQVLYFVYETLFDRVDGEIVPLLATGYENPDENTWVISLREGVEFHDGTPFNSAAVKYSFELLVNPETAAPRASLLASISSIETPDDYTVILRTENPFGPMLAALSHVNASIISPSANAQQDLMEYPVGTGPFVFYARQDGNIVVARNENYWGQEPMVDRAVFKVVPAVDTAISMLQTGQVNFLHNITSDSIPRVQGLSDVEFESVQGSGVNYVVFNVNQGPAADLSFRQAFAKAVDTDGFVQSMDGTAHASRGFAGPHVFGWQASIEDVGTQFDLAAAQAAVADGGFGDTPITIVSATTPLYQRKSEILQLQLTQAGFNVQIETLEWATFLDVLRNGDFDIALAAWANLTQDGSELFFPRLHSASIGSSNSGQYDSAELDALIDGSRTTVVAEQRLAYLNAANEYVLENLPVLPLFHGTTNMAMGSGLRGVTLSANGNWNIRQAYFE